MKDLKITDLRVQPGDSAFLIDDGETAILYDSGFAFTGFALAEKIKEYLGDRKLDYIFLTHLDEDHMNGIQELLEGYGSLDSIKIGEICFPDIGNPDEKYERMWGVNDIREENKHEEETVEQCR